MIMKNFFEFFILGILVNSLKRVFIKTNLLKTQMLIQNIRRIIK